MNLIKIIKEYINNKPKIKKIVGIILIVVGVVSIITPIPGSLLVVIIGFELLGVRIMSFDHFRRHFGFFHRVKASGESKFKFFHFKADPPLEEKKK